MGQACGCADNTASIQDEVKQQNNSAQVKDSQAPQVQNKQSDQTRDVTMDRNKPGLPLGVSNRSYESKSEEQMSRLQKLVVEQDLEIVEELQSPNSGAIYHGYLDKAGIKTGWGT